MAIDLQAQEIQTAEQMIRAIRGLWDGRSIKRLREWLGDIETEEEYYRLMRLADEADLYNYSNLLATHAYKRFGTLRPFAWHCGRLLENGRSLEAEEKMLGRLQGAAASTYKVEELASAHQLLVRVFCQLNRLPEAKEQLAKIEQVRGAVWPDLTGYYYMHSGEWDKAEQVLKKAMIEESTDRDSFARLFYADVLSMVGRQAESLAVLEEGDALEEDSWAYETEQVSRLFHLERYVDALRIMDNFNEKNPFHIHRDHFAYLKAVCLYRLEQWDDLESWVGEHRELLKDSIYGKAEIRRDEKQVLLKTTPKVQKMNYCVPASLSLMLEVYGKDIGQDEIASHVFDVTGTKLRTTMKYMESLGLHARYFKGNVALYKQFIDAGVPILLSMMIENSAHVQVVVGYDDRLQGLIIQDPNDLAPYLLPYADVQKTYRMSDALSMVFVEEEQKHLLNSLDENEHCFFTELYEFLEDEEGEVEESDAFLAFLTAHLEERYAAVIGLSSLFTDRAKALHPQWLERLYSEFGNEDAEVALLAAHMHFVSDQLPEALRCLEHVETKTSPYAQYLKGAILMKQDAFDKAVPLLKRSIEMDPVQPDAYSRLARCYTEMGKVYQAFKWSSIALDQLPSSVSVQINHALIQSESGAHEKALERFRKLAESEPEDEFFIYQVGCCLQQLGRDAEALDAFKRSIRLESGEPFPYLRMAEIHMEAGNWAEAKKALDEGIASTATHDVLHMYLGHVAMEQKEYSKAEAEYRKALELDPKDLFAVSHIAHVLIKQERYLEAHNWIEGYAKEGDAGFYIRTASLLWEEWADHSGKAKALSLLEEGLSDRERDGFHDLAIKHAEFGEEAPLHRTRVLEHIQALREAHPDEILLCLEGELHEEAENHRYARKLYKQALDFADYAPAYYRLGLLEEKREKNEQAILNYRRCIEVDPSFSAAHTAMMRAYTASGKTEQAFTEALHVLEHDPQEVDFEELFALADSEQAVQTIAGTLMKISEKVPEEWLLSAKAHVAEKEGRLKEADALFLEAKATNGAHASYFDHVEFCERQGDFKRAAMLLDEMIAKHPEIVGLYEKYVLMLSRIGKTAEIEKRLKRLLSGEDLAMAKVHSAQFLAQWFEEAEQEEPKGMLNKLRHNTRSLRTITQIISLYEEAIKRLRDNEMPVMQLASLYLARDMAKEAVDELKPFVERTGNYEAALLLIQATLQLADEKESYKLARSAAVAARKLYEQQPSDTRVLLLRGEALAVIDETKKAREQFEEVIRLEPFHAEGYVRLLHLLAERRPGEVPAFKDRLPEQLKDHEWIRLNLGMAYIEVEEAALAQEILLSLIEDEDDYLPAYYELARSEMLLGQKQAAVTHFSHLLKREEGRHYLFAAAEEPAFEDVLEQLEALSAEYA
ncbi:tetratricopeptide repeat protein [Planococcus sp. N064]|uniref:Tetratricopeptide repeat protein n=1 Tax=Planococcus liqunii TaxID=3058394 RepID=A0ABT8MT03_9BACL|nr:tetratricopeptide repeat protein [Planococcus sp. N064]MDN7228035.1 tetratricopeptide repeat protein [Planococcus sp. N064]